MSETYATGREQHRIPSGLGRMIPTDEDTMIPLHAPGCLLRGGPR